MYYTQLTVFAPAGLLPTVYAVEVAAVNMEGAGPFSAPVSGMTFAGGMQSRGVEWCMFQLRSTFQ